MSEQDERKAMVAAIRDLVECGVIEHRAYKEGESVYQLSAEFEAMSLEERNREFQKRLEGLRAFRRAVEAS